MALKNVINALSPVGYGINKYREANKSAKKVNKQVAEGQRQAVKKEKQAAKLHKVGAKEVKSQLKGKGALPSELGDIMHRFERAGEGAEKFYEPIKKNALAEFEQNYLPEVGAQFEGGSRGGSAMNQALAAARGNLERQIASDFAGYKTNYAGNLLNQSQQAKQFNQQNRGNLAQLSLGLPSAYAPPTQQQPTGAGIWGPWATGAVGAIGGGLTAGPGGAVQGFQGGTQIGKALWG